METFVPIKKTDAAKQIVYGEVYVPDVIDSQGDFMTSEAIEVMAHNFMKSKLVKSIDTNHDLETNGSIAVESFIARLGDKDFIPGAWVLGVWLPDEVWVKVEEGEINGFSMYGSGQRVDTVVEIEIPDDGVVKGDTLEQQGHTHGYVLRFGASGEFMGGETVGSDHMHMITKGTITDSAGSDPHEHRYSFLEALT